MWGEWAARLSRRMQYVLRSPGAGALFAKLVECVIHMLPVLVALTPHMQRLHIRSHTNLPIAISAQAPVYTNTDLLVVVRDKLPEVWTMRAFAANELILVPMTNEVKDLALCNMLLSTARFCAIVVFIAPAMQVGA